VFSEEQRKLHLLLEDVSGTHYSELPSQLPPTRRNSELIVQALADIHATWWERPPWDVIGWSLPDQVEVDRRIKDVSDRIARFINFLSDRLTENRRIIYGEVLAALPDLYTRLKLPNAYTVVHDDIHIGNFLYPRNPDKDTIRIIDWQTWLIDLAPKDLAHMMALFWYPEQRQALEIPLLHQYYERLCENGVTNYSWHDLWNDYRLCVIRKLFHPAWQWDAGHEPNIWWNHLERVMMAYEDLDCRELLG
jgi:thiamine kinase-like enzyme